jgi:hypothetical protein
MNPCVLLPETMVGPGVLVADIEIEMVSASAILGIHIPQNAAVPKSNSLLRIALTPSYLCRRGTAER